MEDRPSAGEAVYLADCPIGLFVSAAGELCLKTEYGNNEGRIDAYIVSSGEMFWGAPPQTIASQRAQLVIPVENVILHKRPVAYRVKDYADGWILFHSEEAAQIEADERGAVMQGLYVRDGDFTPRSEASGSPESPSPTEG